MPSGMANDTSPKSGTNGKQLREVHWCKLGGNTVIQSSLCLQ
ncbi:hypothetical protein [Brevibacillus invocatus]|nr:hypothetical protein [Brevibacillus invocatus]